MVVSSLPIVVARGQWAAQKQDLSISSDSTHVYTHIFTESFLDLSWGYNRKGRMLSAARTGAAVVRSRDMTHTTNSFLYPLLLLLG